MIQWVTKRRMRKNDCIDVAIYVYETDITDIAFFGDSYKKITSHEYISYGVDFEQNRIYFQGATSINGYKIHRSGNCMHIRSKNAFSEKLKTMTGAYDLLFDEDMELYYIQLNVR